MPPADQRVRPTADRVREAWMSIVMADIPGATVLDLFAGSGALGLEALSRGADHATFVDVGSRSLAALRKNVAALGAGDRVTIHKADALRFAERLDPGAFDICFADPPYGMKLALELAGIWTTSPFARVIGIEHEKGVDLPGCDDRRVYGDSVVSFFRVA